MQLNYIFSQKGGVGKTTFSWHVACALARRNPDKRVLYIDGTHVQGSRSTSLAPQRERDGEGLGRALAILQGGIIPGIPWDRQQSNLVDATARAQAVLKSVLTPVLIGAGLFVWFIPAAHVVLAEVLKRWQEEQRGQLLKLLLDGLDFDYCFVDTIADPKGYMPESMLAIADSVVFLEDMRDCEALAGFGTLVHDARKSGVKIAGAIGNFLDAKVLKMDSVTLRKSRSNGAITFGIFTETCYNAGIDVLDTFTSDMKTLATAMTPYKDSTGAVSCSMYVEMEENSSNRRNLIKLAERMERLAAVLEA